MLTDPPSRKTRTTEPPSPLASLYARWRAPLLRLLRSRLGNPALAEDATQDVFLRMAIARKQLSADEERPYLHSVARSVTTDSWRRLGGGNALVLVQQEAATDDWTPDAGEGPACPSETAAQRQRLARLEQALAELPERQRQAFLLNRIDGLSHDEVAAAMGISPRMVAKHLNRALAYCALRVHYASVAQMAQLHVADDAAEEPA